MSSLKDVARLAGVSLSTASNALNRKELVAEKTRNKVLSAAEKLNYKPNAVARSLVTGNTRTVGLLIPDISDPYFTEIAKGVDEYARAHDYSVILCNTGRDQVTEERYFRILKEKRVDGIIFTGGGRDNDRHLLQAEDSTSIVVVGRHNVSFTAVMVDNTRAATEVTNFLLDKGHNRIGFIAGTLSYTVSQDRLKGYREALFRKGIACDPMLIREEDFKAKGGHRAADFMLNLPSERRPTAIICANDQMAIGAMGAIWGRGLQVPGDIAVIGFDDIPMASLTCPPLTTVRLPMYDMGYKAMELVLKKISKRKEEEGMPEPQIIFPYEIVIRGTV